MLAQRRNGRILGPHNGAGVYNGRRGSLNGPGNPSSASTIFLNDTFTGTDGTLLSAHTPEIGAAWVKSTATGAGETAEIQNNGGLGYARNTTGASSTVYVAGTASPSLFQKVTVRLHINATLGLWGFGFQRHTNDQDNQGDWMMGGQFRNDAVTRTSDNHTFRKSSPTLTYADEDNITATLKFDGRITMTINNGGADVTQTLKRNDLLNNVQTLASTWPGPGRIFLRNDGAGGAYGTTTQWFADVTGETISPNSATKMICFLGDSITAGLIAGSTSYDNSFPQKLLDYYDIGAGADANVCISNMGIQAQYLADMATYDAAKTSAILNSSYAKNIVVIMGGGNDMAANGQDVSAATAYARLQSLLTALKAVNPASTQYVVTRLLPRAVVPAGANYSARRTSFHTLMDSNHVADGYTIAELGASYMADSDALDVLEYDDGVHPTAAVHALIGGTDLPSTITALL